jgi:hypothetical protein
VRGKWSNSEQVKDIFKQSKTYAQVLRQLGLTLNVTNYSSAKKFVLINSVDTQHFVPYFTTVCDLSKTKRFEDADVFTVQSTYSKSSLKRRIINGNMLPYVCEVCGNDGTWNAIKLSLQLEHKNGDNFDNRLENLCFLCPNCHSQTDTYAGKKNKKHHRTKQEAYFEQKRQNATNNNKHLVDIILSCDIDFSKFGWVRQAAVLLDKQPSRVNGWFKRYMPDFYETRCFKKRI